MIALHLQGKEGMWAEPHNNNPLEKTTLSRQGITAQSKEMKDEDAVRPSLTMLLPAADQPGPAAHMLLPGSYALHI